MNVRWSSWLGWLLPCALGCADPDRFSTGPGESYCGTVVSANFVRAGLEPNSRLRLQLDSQRLQDAPGHIWTDPFTSGERLTGAELAVLPQLAHDPLSQFSFGEGRLRNLLATAFPTSPTPDQGAITVVLSLMQSGEVEVRLLRSGRSATSDDPASLFGVFMLTRSTGDCGLP